MVLKTIVPPRTESMSFAAGNSNLRPLDTEIPSKSKLHKSKPVLYSKPNQAILEDLERFRRLGHVSNKLSYTTVRGPDGIREDTDRIVSARRKSGSKLGKTGLPVGQLTQGQANRINERERAYLRDVDLEYFKMLQQELEIRRCRSMALKRIIFSDMKKKAPVDSSTDEADKTHKKKLENQPSIEERLVTLRGEIDESLLLLAELVAKKDEREMASLKQRAVTVHSPHVLVLKSRIAALSSSISGESYVVKGGLANLSSTPLNYSLATRHLKRYIEHLKRTKISLSEQVCALESDIEFETRLIAEFKMIYSASKSQSFFEASSANAQLQVLAVSNLIKTKNSNAEEECIRLMACLKYLIEAHLAPYLCLYSHRTLAYSVAPSLDKKRKKEIGTVPSKFSISNQLQPAQDIDDMSNVTVVAAKLQSLLVSLLNESIKSTPGKMYCTQTKSGNDSIARLLFQCDVIVRPSRDPHLIHLRDFGKSINDAY